MMVYYLGRFLQLLGMWLLLVALFTAGALGPSPRFFGAGVASFLIGWLVVRQVIGKSRTGSQGSEIERQKSETNV